MKDKTIKRDVPVMKNKKVTTVEAIFFPERKPMDFMPHLKDFLFPFQKYSDACSAHHIYADAHSTPHYLYIDAANWWKDSGKEFLCPDKHSNNIMLWRSYLEDKNLI